MQITEFKVIGLDEARPPKLQRQPCIDLYFELNEIAPEDWCKEFQTVVGKTKYPIKVDPAQGQFIETWVREPGEITASFELVKSSVARSNAAYRALLAKRSGAPVDEGAEVKITPEQQRLNEIVAGLSFD